MYQWTTFIDKENEQKPVSGCEYVVLEEELYVPTLNMTKVVLNLKDLSRNQDTLEAVEVFLVKNDLHESIKHIIIQYL